MISVLLSSAAGIGAAFVGNTIYPIKGGGEPVEVKKAPAEEPKPEETKEEEQPNAEEPKLEKEEPKPEEAKPEEPRRDKLTTAIMDGFKMDEEFARNVVDFIKTPVTSWKDIANTPTELRQKFKKTLTHPNLNKCPTVLKDVCKIVAVKYSNMKDFIDEKDYMAFGDETADALNVLSSSSSL